MSSVSPLSYSWLFSARGVELWLFLATVAQAAAILRVVHLAVTSPCSFLVADGLNLALWFSLFEFCLSNPHCPCSGRYTSLSIPVSSSVWSRLLPTSSCQVFVHLQSCCQGGLWGPQYIPLTPQDSFHPRLGLQPSSPCSVLCSQLPASFLSASP